MKRIGSNGEALRVCGPHQCGQCRLEFDDAITLSAAHEIPEQGIVVMCPRCAAHVMTYGAHRKPVQSPAPIELQRPITRNIIAEAAGDSEDTTLRVYEEDGLWIVEILTPHGSLACSFSDVMPGCALGQLFEDATAAMEGW